MLSISPINRILSYAFIVISVLAPEAALAQTQPVWLLNFTQSFGGNNNQSLSSPSDPATVFSTSQLGLEFRKATSIDSLTFNVSGTLRGDQLIEGDTSGDFELSNAQIGGQYDYRTTNTGLTVSGNVTSSPIEFIRSIDEFIDPVTGVINIPTDQDALTGVGDRRGTNLNASIRLFEQARFGITLSTGLGRIDYFDTTSPDLVDNQRVSYGTNFRVNLTSTTDAQLSFGYDDFTADDSPSSSETSRVDLSLNQAFTNGQGSIQFGFSAEPNGDDRTNISVERGFSSQTNNLNFNIGNSRTRSGNSDVTGEVRLDHSTPDGSVTARFNRAISSTSDDNDRLTTLVSLSYNQNITDNQSYGIDTTYIDVQRQDLNSTDTVDISAGGSYSIQFAQVWNVSTGVRYRRRMVEGGEDANSTNVFLNLARSWSR